MGGALSTSVDIALNSLVLGGVFLIVAVGLNIIYGLSRVMNLAHGSLYAIGAYAGYTLVATGLNYFVAILIAPIAVAAVGLLLERSIIAPMRKRSMIYTLIITYGLMFLLDGLIKHVWGNEPRFIELPAFIRDTVPILGTHYPIFRLVTLLITAATMTGLMLFLSKTKIGMILRAASTIPEMVSCLGINMNYVHIGAFVLGCALAGIAGTIAGPLTTIDPLMGHEMLISSFVVIVIGGLGSLRGAVIAALLIGFVQTLAEFFVTDLAMVIVYMLMAVILAFMPRGLLRRRKIRVMTDHTTIPDAPKGTSALKIVVILLIIVALALFPFVITNRFYISLVNEMLIYGLLAMSLDVLLGYTGLLSFMHNAYLGISAYVVGLVLIHISPTSLWMACLAGVLFATLVALPVGWVQVRTGGLAFALLTLAFGMMFHTIVWKWYSLTGGDDGLMGMPNPSITLFGWEIGNSGDPTVMYLFTLSIVLVCFFLTRRIIHSPFGAVLEAIRENEERAAFVGINVRRFKLFGWLLACMLAGVAGALFILYKGYIGPTTMSAFAGAGVLMMVLLGGMGTLWGPLVGAAIFIYIQDYISTMTEHWEIYLGIVVILLVLFMPTGFVGLGAYFKRLRKG